ncbi:hypothetical protein, partial [Enterobacter intestinihominis]
FLKAEEVIKFFNIVLVGFFFFIIKIFCWFVVVFFFGVLFCFWGWWVWGVFGVFFKFNIKNFKKRGGGGIRITVSK